MEKLSVLGRETDFLYGESVLSSPPDLV